MYRAMKGCWIRSLGACKNRPSLRRRCGHRISCIRGQGHRCVCWLRCVRWLRRGRWIRSRHRRGQGGAGRIRGWRRHRCVGGIGRGRWLRRVGRLRRVQLYGGRLIANYGRFGGTQGGEHAGRWCGGWPRLDSRAAAGHHNRHRQRAGSDSQERAQCAPPGIPFKHTFIYSGSSLGQGSLLSSDAAYLLGLAAPASARICTISLLSSRIARLRAESPKVFVILTSAPASTRIRTISLSPLRIAR